MFISDDMIHPDIQKQGAILRKLYRFKSKASFVNSQRTLNLVKRFMITKQLVCEEHFIAYEDNPNLRICVYKSRQASPDAVGLLWMHGGGYAMGTPEQDLPYIKRFINATNCVVVAPDYRLSLDFPYPAALNDCYNTLLWIKHNADYLNIRSDQIFAGGNSAGGGLTAAVALMARDKGEVNLAFQMPLYPMLDDRMITTSSQNNDAPVWDSAANLIAWKLYLGSLYGTDSVPYYAAPARAEDLTNLPPAYTFVGDIEPFFDETRDYFSRLNSSGIEANIDIYSGCFHGFNISFPKAEISVLATNKYIQAFKYASENYFAPQK